MTSDLYQKIALISWISSFYCSSSLPLASTRWVWSTFSNHCSLSSNQHCSITSTTSTIFSSEKKSATLGIEHGAAGKVFSKNSILQPAWNNQTKKLKMKITERWYLPSQGRPGFDFFLYSLFFLLLKIRLNRLLPETAAAVVKENPSNADETKKCRKRRSSLVRVLFFGYATFFLPTHFLPTLFLLIQFW